jgi:hypothetical protein
MSKRGQRKMICHKKIDRIVNKEIYLGSLQAFLPLSEAVLKPFIGQELSIWMRAQSVAYKIPGLNRFTP